MAWYVYWFLAWFFASLNCIEHAGKYLVRSCVPIKDVDVEWRFWFLCRTSFRTYWNSEPSVSMCYDINFCLFLWHLATLGDMWAVRETGEACKPKAVSLGSPPIFTRPLVMNRMVKKKPDNKIWSSKITSERSKGRQEKECNKRLVIVASSLWLFVLFPQSQLTTIEEKKRSMISKRFSTHLCWKCPSTLCMLEL